MTFDPEIWLIVRKPFNPADWLPAAKRKKQSRPVESGKSKTGIGHDIEVIVRRIEAYQLDLTCNYSDWLTLGFALADEFGETGRDWFHRISRFHPDYDPEKCDKQFDHCRANRRYGITIKTFFYLAQSAGINIKV
ncbi:PriCT-2 domain-containing protein [Gaoshiqia sediminis]|uniref:PriCT-2 domain-containing protein n=1 Tax=Gaoshiqia sediminis TaxID=2986998 RepID=A0AA42C7E9_9BACT|nr:PriCT-2 domain-containing protein [Gaoshiqia sediminis]MCW0483499.1 PriCT-2 domain-containing protein [Gaoshiqia sediminis]